MEKWYYRYYQDDTVDLDGIMGEGGGLWIYTRVYDEGYWSDYQLYLKGTKHQMV